MAQPSYDLSQVAQESRITNCVAYSLLGLAVYEYVITLNQEIAAVWRRKLTATSLLLLTIRWLMVLNPFLSAALPAERQVWCTPYYIVITFVYLTVTFLISVFSALRVYALWQGSRMKYAFTAIVLTLGIIPLGTNIFHAVRTSITYVDGQQLAGCSTFTNIPPKLTTELLFLTRCSLIASDVIVLVLTWTKSFAHWRQMRRFKLTSSISSVLLRDGTLYFLALLGMSILQLLTYSTSLVGDGTYATGFIQYLPPLLVQRFILNLRQHDYNAQASENNSDAQHVSRLTMSFRVPSDFLGNIGEPLDHSRSEQVDDDDDEDHCVAEVPREGLEEGVIGPCWAAE
ncbi:uncharacterized protein PHACADRAFT_246073 [Phanerochaete carnosa HHB-10118-sp]|uniref:DUF6533 domain-containing protein n=1 Tax=Phanerochaete carnosa (strain HHB-10118-sp) TaxID=650164 RepID=K5WLB7_PHACS|nr:uncharacterized protein PHACADRAFT_246073 [Phanerochaete carnosa HHB-10118-sp]EKM60225.1 hypothetical protein PHACADRAFT_246073 [Phanerochaete carnosa HHB-10118-sp]